MNKFFIVIALVITPIFLTAQINYQPWTPSQAIASAQSSGKYIVVSFEATWCQPCQWMKKNIYNRTEISSKINRDFIAIKSDMTSPNEWSEKYDVEVLPYVMILDANGQKVADLAGSSNVSEFGMFLDCKCQVKVPPPPKPVYASMATNTDSVVDRYWTVQIGKYVGSFYANRLKNNASEAFEDVHIRYEKDKYGKDIYRVFVGLFVDERTAKYTLDLLRNQGYKGFTKYL